jgi:hypothetical protein
MRSFPHPRYLSSQTSREKQAIKDKTRVSLALEVNVDALSTFVSDFRSRR